MAAAAATHSPLSPSTASSPPSLSSSVSNVLSRLTVESVPELQWETLPVRMEEGGRVGCAAAAVSRNELVVAGGSNGYLSILALAKLLNVDRNKWTDLPNMNNPRFCCGAATIATTDTEQSQPRRRVYVVGGVNKSGVVLSSVEVFDLSVDPPHWSVLKKNMSCGRWGSAVVSHRDRLYVIGGHNGTVPLQSSEVYLESTGEWRSLPDMSVARSQCSAAVIDGRIYVLGGTNFESTYSSCEVYDMSTNTWSSTALPSMKVARSGCCAAAIGNQLFCVGQVIPHYFNYQTYLSFLLVDTPNKSNVACGETINVAEDQQWMRLPPMATLRYRAALVALGNHQLVIVGGESRDKRHDTIERLALTPIPVFVDFPPLPPCIEGGGGGGGGGGEEDENKRQDPTRVLRELELWLDRVHGLMESTDTQTQGIQSELTDRKERSALRHRQAVAEEEQALEQSILRHQQAIQNLEIQAQRERARIEKASDAIREAFALWKSNATSAVEQAQRRVQALYRETNLAPAALVAAPDLVCPLGKQLMEDPVVAADGHTYERQRIQEWLDANSSDEATKSPVTGQVLAHTHLIPNLAIRKQCQQHQQQQQQ